MATRVHSIDVSTVARPSTTGEHQFVEGCISQARTPSSNDLSREEEDYTGQRDDCAKTLEPEIGEETPSTAPNPHKRTLLKRVQTIFRTSMEKVTTKIEQSQPSQRNLQQMKGLLDVLDDSGNESVRYTERLGENWRQYQGCNNFWAGLLDPLDPVLRAEIYRYGKFAKATYDAFNRDTGDAKYCDKKDFLKQVRLEKRGYEITDFLYTTAQLSHLQSFSNTNLKKKSNWMGFVAVCTDPYEIRRLGRRDIVVAWRGTVTWLEWIKDFQFWPKPVEFNKQSDANKGVLVHGGFLSLYNSSNEESCSGKMSARDQVLESVKGLVEKYEEEDKDIKLSITVTGHSLGSALATLCACDIAEWISDRRKETSSFGSDSSGVDRSENASGESSPNDRIPITVYSFAGPRVGKQAFKKRIETLNVPVLRVVNKGDVVPVLPILQSYKHVGIKLKVNNLKCDYCAQKHTPVIVNKNAHDTTESKSTVTTESEKTILVHAHHTKGILQKLNFCRYHRLRYLLDALSPTCDSSYNIAVARRKLKGFYRFIVAATKFRPALKRSILESGAEFELSPPVQRFEEGIKQELEVPKESRSGTLQ